jgi:dihydrodipicolinate synthase/N-acetylneuraminate lyase
MSDTSQPKPKRPGCGCGADGDITGCYHHDPKRASERVRNASRAATAKADKEVREVKQEIRRLIAMVREEGFDSTAANAINRLYNTLLAYILAERGIFREEDLAVRIRELGEGK